MTRTLHGPFVPRESDGYYLIYLPGHPLANAGLVWVHRAMLFAKIGEGPHLCHWCATPLTWGLDLHTDHLNTQRGDNRPENLVQSCRSCNLARREYVVDHGTPTMYGKGCRCEPCRTQNAAYRARWLDGLPPLADDDRRHGCRSTYANYGCRCAPCTASQREYDARRRAPRPRLVARSAA